MSREKKRFGRAYEGRLMLGVCAGLADFLGVNPWIVRGAVAVLVPLTGGVALAAYLLMGYLLPDADRAPITDHRKDRDASREEKLRRIQEKNERETWFDKRAE